MTTLPGLETWSIPSLNRMISYFGQKSILARYYTAPKYNTIIEPFAGGAGYSLMYPDRQVKLFDIYPTIVEVWDYLIHVSESEFRSLPLGPWVRGVSKVTDEPICDAAKKLIGFWLVESQEKPYPHEYNRGASWTESVRERIASQLQYIRHWTVEQKSFEEIDNETATWFIDPPYQISGSRYVHNSSKIDYPGLGKWCQSRSGHVIVCEGVPKKEGVPPPTWLPFEELGTFLNASNETYGELVWER